MAATSFTLSDGRKIPSVGLGTWQSPKGEVAKAVEFAIKVRAMTATSNDWSITDSSGWSAPH